ncbi:hypothetical protein Q5752_002079 [Cryptotrichosporon argae]
MSRKTGGRQDLLVRVRFQNPIPQPPFPPKLFTVPTDIHRLGEPSYLDQLASNAPLPMLVDSEMGMPLDLNAYEGVWDGNDASLNPTLDPAKVTNPIDIALLAPLKARDADGAAKVKAEEVSWMRNSSYIQRKTTAARRKELADAERAEIVDASEAAQVAAIDKSFSDVRDQKVEDIRHPDAKRKHLRVVDTYDILPDDEAFANLYCIFRFPERPSTATTLNMTGTVSDQRLKTALLQSTATDDPDHATFEFFLPSTEEESARLADVYEHPVDDAAVDKVNELVTEDKEDEIDAIMPSVKYDRIRTYETVSLLREKDEGARKFDYLRKEVVLTFHEDDADGAGAGAGDDGDMFGDEPAKKKRKGVFYNHIGARMVLRKVRTKARDDPDAPDVADKMRIGFQRLEGPLAEGVRARRARVIDPTWVDDDLRRLRGGDNEIEGLGEAIDDEEPPQDVEAERLEKEAHDDDE